MAGIVIRGLGSKFLTTEGYGATGNYNKSGYFAIFDYYLRQMNFLGNVVDSNSIEVPSEIISFSSVQKQIVTNKIETVPETTDLSIANYYLKQMNFLGNL